MADDKKDDKGKGDKGSGKHDVTGDRAKPGNKGPFGKPGQGDGGKHGKGGGKK